VRDKDANGSVIMFCEMAAHAKSRGQTVDQLLDEIFSTFGYFQEKNGSLVFEGAEGGLIAPVVFRFNGPALTAVPVKAE
jgi:phosphoglucomutase